MKYFLTLKNETTSQSTCITLRLCNTFFLKFKGLMFQKDIKPLEGLVFDEFKDTKVNTAIHMLFMRFPIGVLWVNSEKIIVSKTYAKPWKLMYTPEKPARFVIEVHPEVLNYYQVGDKIIFDEKH
ncbi:MAG: DUF192 domain-containing protein [Anaerolineaceae bacterium]